jgi:hypothetical protein
MQGQVVTTRRQADSNVHTPRTPAHKKTCGGPSSPQPVVVPCGTIKAAARENNTLLPHVCKAKSLNTIISCNMAVLHHPLHKAPPPQVTNTGHAVTAPLLPRPRTASPLQHTAILSCVTLPPSHPKHCNTVRLHRPLPTPPPPPLPPPPPHHPPWHKAQAQQTAGHGPRHAPSDTPKS